MPAVAKKGSGLALNQNLPFPDEHEIIKWKEKD
jgi:hypothetical protein